MKTKYQKLKNQLVDVIKELPEDLYDEYTDEYIECCYRTLEPRIFTTEYGEKISTVNIGSANLYKFINSLHSKIKPELLSLKLTADEQEEYCSTLAVNLLDELEEEQIITKIPEEGGIKLIVDNERVNE